MCRGQACDSYEAAHKLRPASHAALYNWGVALSDMARLLKAVNPGASYDFLLAATEKYGRSLEHNPNNPQARHHVGTPLHCGAITHTASCHVRSWLQPSPREPLSKV